MTEGIYDLTTGKQVESIEDTLIRKINELSTK